MAAMHISPFLPLPSRFCSFTRCFFNFHSTLSISPRLSLLTLRSSSAPPMETSTNVQPSVCILSSLSPFSSAAYSLNFNMDSSLCCSNYFFCWIRAKWNWPMVLYVSLWKMLADLNLIQLYLYLYSLFEWFLLRLCQASFEEGIAIGVMLQYL